MGPGSIHGTGHLFQYVTNQPPRTTQPSIPPGSGNKYQLRLGRQRQVWFILLADKCGQVERMPYLSALEMCSRQGAKQIHIYLYLYLQSDALCPGQILHLSTEQSLIFTFCCCVEPLSSSTCKADLQSK